MWSRRLLALSGDVPVKALVYPVSMEIGGSQLNAIELAAEIAARGDDVVLFGPDGDLVPVARNMGLEYIVSPRPPGWPARATMDALVDLVKSRGIDVVHGYEWSPSLALTFGPHRRLGTAMVTSVLSMSVPSVIARHEPIIVGTRELYEEQLDRRDRVYLMEPPIDTARNAPGQAGPDARKSLGLAADDLVVAVVCRLTTDLGKARGVHEAIEVTKRLGVIHPLRLVVVGAGTELNRVSEHAAETNRVLGRSSVVVTGGMLDPRAAYDVADVVLGMGSSALKGMAFAKPVVVQGEDGFWHPLTETNLPTFLAKGWFGHGGAGAADLERALAPLLGDAGLRRDRGVMGREVVVERYSLSQAASALRAIYTDAIERRPTRERRAAALRRCAYDVAKDRLAMAVQRTAAKTSPRASVGGNG